MKKPTLQDIFIKLDEIVNRFDKVCDIMEKSKSDYYKCEKCGCGSFEGKCPRNCKNEATNQHGEVKDGLITIVDDGRKTSEIMQECRGLFKVYSYCDDERLDKEFPPIKSVRKFHYIQEPDEKYANKSYDDLQKEGVQGITLRERLLFEIAYFKKEGKHLDEKNWTLCSGSWSVGGSVPRVSFHDGGVRVHCCHAGDSSYGVRSRSAVE